MKNKLKNSRGITLVALVVTIVVLLILSGVSINLVIGQNGIISKAKEAKKEYEQAKLNEEQDLQKINDWMNKKIPTPLIKVTEGTKASKNGTINGKEATAMNPIIPQGYIPINQGEAIWGDGTTAPTANSVNKGLVITDSLKDGNEWVWVPVPNPSELYEEKSDTITQGGVNVTTAKYTKSGILPGRTRGIPNSEDYREPGIVQAYDKNTKYLQQVGFTASAKMQDLAESLVKDYNEMIGSLEKYHGFYIGRYELSSEGEKKNRPTLTNVNWYQLYAKSKNLNANNSVETRMIWGLQWDVTCKWIANNGDEKDIYDSRAWGNYKDSIAPANGGNYVSNKMKNTGSNEAWKANNIYDFAGNCEEWTQEANSFNLRVPRGASCIVSGYEIPVIHRDPYSFFSDHSNFDLSSRSTLYVK